VNAEVPVGSLEHALKIVEAERIVGREGAHNAKTNPFVNQAIEFWEFGRARHRVFMYRFTMLLPNVPLRLGAFTG
jgi:hypothetical protein